MTQTTHPSEKRAFTGYFIPVNIVLLFDAKKINAMEMVLLALIDSLSKQKGYCYANNSFLSKKMGVNNRQLGNLLNNLEKVKTIKRRVRQDGSRRIFIRK